MNNYLYKINKRVSQCGLICVLLAYLSAFIYGIIIFLGMDYGYFVILDSYFSRAGIFFAFVALVLILISRQYWRGLIYVCLTLISALPFIYLDYQVKKTVERRVEAEKKYTGEYNLRLLGKELIKFGKDNNGCLPPADQWCDCLMKFNSELTKENFRHPLSPKEIECNYVFNKNLSNRKLKEISDKTVLLYESEGEWNLNGNGEFLKRRNYDSIEKSVCFLYFDGTVRNYWFDERKIRDFKSYFGEASMYYTEPRWNP